MHCNANTVGIHKKEDSGAFFLISQTPFNGSLDFYICFRSLILKTFNMQLPHLVRDDSLAIRCNMF